MLSFFDKMPHVLVRNPNPIAFVNLVTSAFLHVNVVLDYSLH